MKKLVFDGRNFIQLYKDTEERCVAGHGSRKHYIGIEHAIKIDDI